MSFFLNKEMFKTDGDISTLHEFNVEINIQSVLFYPSSGFDINDLYYVNSKRIEEINNFSPKIHIHSDFLHSKDYSYPTFEQLLLSYKRFRLISALRFFTDKKSIHIFKLGVFNSDEIKWLIFFRGYYNEEILEALLKTNIKVPVIYSVCDGITHGMGGGCHDGVVPTILYPLLPSSLGIKFIITEQGWDTVKIILEDPYRLRSLRVWLGNVLLISDNPFISMILKLSDQELIETLIQKLKAIDEQLLNTNGKLRLYAGGFSYDIILKKLNI